MHFMSNCVFVDEAAFHINMKRFFYAWSKCRCSCTQDKNKNDNNSCCYIHLGRCQHESKTTQSNGHSIKKVKLRVMGHPQPSKSEKVVLQQAIILTSLPALYVMDKHEEFEGSYIIMDNAPIHTNKTPSSILRVEVIDVFVFHSTRRSLPY